jgi:hypothetical protein
MCVGAVVLINSNNYMNVCKLYCKIFEIVVHDGIFFLYPHVNLCKTTCQFFLFKCTNLFKFENLLKLQKLGEYKLARIIHANVLECIESIDMNKRNYMYYFILPCESRFGVKKFIGALLNVNGVVHKLVNKIVVIVIQTFI